MDRLVWLYPTLAHLNLIPRTFTDTRCSTLLDFMSFDRFVIWYNHVLIGRRFSTFDTCIFWLTYNPIMLYLRDFHPPRNHNQIMLVHSSVDLKSHFIIIEGRVSSLKPWNTHTSNHQITVFLAINYFISISFDICIYIEQLNQTCELFYNIVEQTNKSI